MGGVNLALSTPSGAESKEVVSADYVLNKAGGLPVGFILSMPFGVDESENKFRYLNGQTIIQTQFPVFTAKVKSWQTTRANLFTTETNWQAEKTNSKLGQCGKFVIDDTAGTIRLPCVVNINGLVDLANCGMMKSESLPNITGKYTTERNLPVDNNATGVFSSIPKASTEGKVVGIDQNYAGRPLLFNASNSSSTYQDNAPVQQEAIQYPYVICVNSGVTEADRPINNYQVNNVYSYGMSQYYKGVMNNNSWLRSQGQWNDGTVYTGVYNWVVEQMNAGVDGFKGTKGYAYSDTGTTDYYWWLSTETPEVGMTVYEYNDKRLYKCGVVEEITGTGFTFVSRGGKPMLSDATYTVTRNATYDTDVILNSRPDFYWIDDYDWVINTAEQTFRLPLLNGQEGVFADDVKGNGTSIGLIDKYGTLLAFGGQGYVSGTGNGYSYTTAASPEAYGTPVGTAMGNYAASASNTTFGLTDEADKSGIIVDKTVPSGYNLYFYIGDTLQNAQLVNVARIEEKLTDINAASRGYVVDSYHSDTGWYRIYSDGWIEQGGVGNAGANIIHTLLKPFSNAKYFITATPYVEGSSCTDTYAVTIKAKTASNFTTYLSSAYLHFDWQACGY